MRWASALTVNCMPADQRTVRCVCGKQRSAKHTDCGNAPNPAKQTIPSTHNVRCPPINQPLWLRACVCMFLTNNRSEKDLNRNTTTMNNIKPEMKIKVDKQNENEFKHSSKWQSRREPAKTELIFSFMNLFFISWFFLLPTLWNDVQIKFIHWFNLFTYIYTRTLSLSPSLLAIPNFPYVFLLHLSCKKNFLNPKKKNRTKRNKNMNIFR